MKSKYKGEMSAHSQIQEALANKFVRVAAIGVEYTELADALRRIIDREKRGAADRGKRHKGTLAEDTRILKLVSELEQILTASIEKVQQQRRQHLPNEEESLGEP
ncbi:hypothetical protein [Burkholderia cenocepacia]|uniref:hypothetical protein n=1 Tax=Burkholderia cenocepacia TaxID=95486 RepID=UPI001CF18224|nr:hypothetical protein [Burkholderia cenocepacia]MCA7962397.1 hypothetical protein [Burkholderia cenocepacia]MDR8054416.1 hypothetical protein [Burkholderia cenocepacia]MDR8064859.1 hypothetical protein [Burkholderia cenocepacia]